MTPPSLLSLENAVRRKMSENPGILGDPEAFDDLCRPYFLKSSAIKGMKAYLSGRESAPYILACLIYSSHGQRELQGWVRSGMPAAYLYRTMLHDGGYWANENTPLRIRTDILEGGAGWDFDYRMLVEAIFSPGVTPGLIDAVVERALKNGQMADFVSVLPQVRLAGLIEGFPSAFAPITAQLNIPSDATASEIARKICSNWLSPERSVMKMLLHCA